MTDTRKHYHVVAAVIEVDGKVLCMQRGVTRYPYTSHMWEFPGGKIEPGETPQQALHRELLEEMNMDVAGYRGPTCRRSPGAPPTPA